MPDPALIASVHNGSSDSPIPRRVLVVDDEPTIRIALRRFFGRMGWTFDEASDGETALRMILGSFNATAQADVYSLVLSDLRMPGLSGIDLYERLRVERPEILPRIIFSTGDVVSEEAAAFVDSTSCVVLQKPFELSTLRRLIDQVLSAA
jgi:CheY-like chemotaxis protein